MLNLILIIGFYLLVSGATPFYCPVKLRFCVRSNSCIVVRFRPIFALNSFSPIDTKFISDKYQLSTFDSNVTFTSRTIQRYKQLIKTHLGINEYNNDIESKLQQYAIELANNFTHRKKIFFS